MDWPKLGGREVSNLKSRGVTRFFDLSRVNQRNVEEIQSDEEEFPDAGPPRQRPPGSYTTSGFFGRSGLGL